MQWYYKLGLIFGLLWAAARALGAAGDAQRDLDINFLFGFMLTVGGWSAVFLVVDWVLRATGLRKVPAAVTGSPAGGSTPGAEPAAAATVEPIAAAEPSTSSNAAGPDASSRRRRRSRR